MIIEALISVVKTFILGILSGFTALSIPTDFVSGLGTFIGYGNYVIGGDLLLVVMTSVIFWYGLRFVVSSVTYIYKLLPFIG